jgi:3-methyladenine DNA glycosylase AlkD
MNTHHKELLKKIKAQSGTPTQHTFMSNYLGNEHPRYPISNPLLRNIAKTWMADYDYLNSDEIAELITSLTNGESFTEKIFAGILLDYCHKNQRAFAPILFERWLNQLEGWAEVDTLCTGRYAETEVIMQWSKWKPLLKKFSRSKNIHKRRASLVLLCSPLRKLSEPELATVAFENIKRLKKEKEALITKAISWVMRSMVKHHRMALIKFMKEETDLPAIALRETMKVLKTGKKTK